ncbi:2-hydroxyacid dehydrogenase [Actinopolymorpha singaporensis]|uniref:D-3-phosphoglycerate dehydrogenase n=1 Tax=Actinopolymorpha singaporensis TaxID=117157 RepID=A0A1H1VQJ6_9ACTN|nr:2-hydroxyacid dehydrogenase [Actinopolymorpha singaporensis]SDS87214.1 D-3-phosphoglycerate dehydrogenase [Actinopolymorpha singaporensis]
MRTLVIGDHYIPASAYVEALAGAGLDPAGVRTVDWSGGKADQHAAQQRMEKEGPGVVPVPAEIVAAVGDAQALALHFAPVPAAVLDAGPDLRAVVVARAGLENVDIEAATARGIAVVPIAGRNASGVAELAIGLMISEGRSVARADASVKAGGWRKDFGGPGTEIGGSTVGLVGFGHVGRELARRLRGFGVRLLVADPYVDDDVLAAHDATRVDLDTVFAESDFVHVLARLTPETERFVGAAQFALMKPTAYFVNTSRARLVDHDALYDALAEGRIAGAGLDVYDSEPLPPDSPWRSLDNVTLTTHFGGETHTTNTRSARLVAEAIAELHRTGQVASAVNASALGWA